MLALLCLLVLSFSLGVWAALRVTRRELRAALRASALDLLSNATDADLKRLLGGDGFGAQPWMEHGEWERVRFASMFLLRG